MAEEEVIVNQMEVEDEYKVYKSIPYFLLDDEMSEAKKQKYNEEFFKIAKLYDIYRNGCDFIKEGCNGHYVPSNLRYKKSTMIMNKEVRFLFSNAPTFNVNVDDVSGEYAQENAVLQDFLDKVIEKTNFHGKLLKGLKDCFIGKRVAIVLNINEEYGFTITFLNSMEFIFEVSDGDDDEIIKFVSFCEKTGVDSLSEQRWFKKVYEKEITGVYLTERIYSGTGDLIEEITPRTKIKFNYIPVAVVLNDGLTGDLFGVSEIGELISSEAYYSKLANADMDAERKSMNPIRYTIDASQESTSNLSSSPGSYWDLQSDEDKPMENQAKVGTLEAQMNYSGPLKTTLERIENQMYSAVDVPNITSEQLAGVITSGKTIQALYWGLTVRCDEKMLAWAPALRKIAYAIIEGGILYPNCISRYTSEKSIPQIEFDIIVENNYPIPEDVKEEKETDIAEVEANIMSRKAYMKKWRKLNDMEADDEIKQIKFEYDILNNSFIDYSANQTVNTEVGGVDEEN